MTTSELKYDTWMAQTVLFQQQWLKCNLIVGRFSLVLTGQLVNNLFPLGVFSLCSPDISHELINMQWGGYGTGERSYYMTVLLSVYGYVKGECTRTRFPALWVGLIKQKQWSTAIHTSISHSAINPQPRCPRTLVCLLGSVEGSSIEVPQWHLSCRSPKKKQIVLCQWTKRKSH